MKRTAHHRHLLVDLRPAAAVSVVTAVSVLTVLLTGCTATSSGAPPAESVPVSAARTPASVSIAGPAQATARHR